MYLPTFPLGFSLVPLNCCWNLQFPLLRRKCLGALTLSKTKHRGLGSQAWLRGRRGRRGTNLLDILRKHLNARRLFRNPK